MHIPNVSREHGRQGDKGGYRAVAGVIEGLAHCGVEGAGVGDVED
jgi:hypothetical protein